MIAFCRQHARYVAPVLVLLAAPFVGFGAAFAAPPAQAPVTPLSLTPELLSSIAAVSASLAFAYVPGLKGVYASLTAEWKAASMGLVLIAIAGAAFAIGCGGFLPELQVTCDRGGAVGLISALIAALVANQGTFLLAVKPFKSETAALGASGPFGGLTCGRTVHFVGSKAGKPKHLAATVVHVWDTDPARPNGGLVNLFVPPDMYDFDAEQYPTSVVYDATGARIGSWHWPERAE